MDDVTSHHTKSLKKYFKKTYNTKLTFKVYKESKGFLLYIYTYQFFNSLKDLTFTEFSKSLMEYFVNVNNLSSDVQVVIQDNYHPDSFKRIEGT
jgi:hypothetical protein